MDRDRKALQTRGRPFRKGQSGNPGGRPKDLLTQVIRARLTEEDAGAIAAMLIGEAKGGNLKAAEILWDRLEGKPTVRQEIGGAGGGPLEITEIRVRPPEDPDPDGA